MAPFRAARDLLTTIPGVSTGVADVIIAETGADMTRFPSPGHLASWAGTCPGINESAGRVKSTTTRPGNRYLKGALGVAAMAATRSKDTYLAARYRRIAARRGPLKALVAIERTRSSSRSGTCSPTTPPTPTPARTTSPDATPTGPRHAPSTSSATSATTSPSHQPRPRMAG